jgi:hypothetical protein
LHEKLSGALADDLKVCSAGDMYEHINNIRQYALFHGQNDLLDSIMSVDHISTINKNKQILITFSNKRAIMAIVRSPELSNSSKQLPIQAF